VQAGIKKKKHIPFEAKRNHIHHIDVQCDQQTSRSLGPFWRRRKHQDIPPSTDMSTNSPEGGGSKTHRRSCVHGVSQDIERKLFHLAVHQNPKVVAEESACDSQSKGRTKHQKLSKREQGNGNNRRERFR
jgi:hypothetical protein